MRLYCTGVTDHKPTNFFIMVPLHLLSLLALGSSALAQDAFQSHCTSFADKINLPNVKVNFANYVSGGTNLSLADNPPSCGASSQSVAKDVCRIAMAVATSNSSEITLEAWFPRNYTGRFLSTGNGGISGCMCFPCAFEAITRISND